MEIKPKWDTIIQVLEWLKSKTLLTPDASKQEELSLITGGNAWQYDLSGDSVKVSYKLESIHTI